MNKNTHAQFFICMLIVIFGVFSIYMLQKYVSTFRTRLSDLQIRFKGLELEKKNIETYKKILSKGTEEEKRMSTYVLDEKSTFRIITSIEKEGKNLGMFESDDLGLISVSKRENAELKNMQAGEVVIEIETEEETERVHQYIELLDNLPYVSHIEKISYTFSENKKRTKARITLILTEFL